MSIHEFPKKKKPQADSINDIAEFLKNIGAKDVSISSVQEIEDNIENATVSQKRMLMKLKNK